MVSYTKTVGIIINVIVATIALAVVLLSIFRLKVHLGNELNIRKIWLFCTAFLFADLDWTTIVWEFALIIVLQFLSLCLAVAMVVILSLIFDAASRSMSWFSNQWLIIGLYYFPLFFALGIVPATYLSIRNRVTILWRKFLTLTNIRTDDNQISISEFHKT